MPPRAPPGYGLARMDDYDPGAKFWWKLAGLFVVGAIALFIVMAVFVKLIYAWGFLGTLLFFAVLALIAGYFADRRNAGTS
jgi:hypothetical protein